MNVHQNARLTPHSRAELVRQAVVEVQAQVSGGTQHAIGAGFETPPESSCRS